MLRSSASLATSTERRSLFYTKRGKQILYHSFYCLHLLDASRGTDRSGW